MNHMDQILKGFYSLSNESLYTQFLENCIDVDLVQNGLILNYCDMNPIMKRFYSLANELWPPKFLEACKNKDFDTAQLLFDYCYTYLDYCEDQAFLIFVLMDIWKWLNGCIRCVILIYTLIMMMFLFVVVVLVNCKLPSGCIF